MTVPVKIDYSTSVPETVIGHCCYYKKCVWSVHVYPIEAFSVKLMYSELLSVEVFRRFVPIPKDSDTREGQRFTLSLYKASVRYALLRAVGYDHREALNDVFLLLPDKLRENAGAFQYFEQTIKTLVEKAEKFVKSNIHRAPETGWSILTDETYTLEPLIFPASYLPRILAYTLRLPKTYTNLVFCDEKRCYPTPEGIWPSNKWLYSIGQSLRHDVYFYFIENFGATNIMEYLANLDVDEVAISVRPGRKRAKITLYVPVKNPERHVVRVAKMQELIDKVVRQVETLMLYELEKPDAEDGLRILGITEDDIYRVVKKIYEKKRLK